MKQSKDGAEMAFVRAGALKNLAQTTDEELLEEFAADGVDVRDIAAQMREKLSDVCAAAMRARVATAKERMKSSPFAEAVARARPSIETAKEMIRAALERNPKLGVAFRDGKTQSEADVMSLYEDLVSTGDIVPKDDGH